MPCGSKIRSARSISCTWYCTVRRSSKAQVACGPTAIWRSPLWRSTRARKALRSRAYCSSGMRSVAESLFIPGLRETAAGRFSNELEPIRDAQQPQRMRRRPRRCESALDLLAGHRAIARIVVCRGRFHALYHWAADADRSLAKARLEGIGAVVPRAALDGLDGAAGDQSQQVARLQAEVLHAQVTGHVVAHLAERGLEVGAQETCAVPQHQVFERIEHALGDALHRFILRV